MPLPYGFCAVFEAEYQGIVLLGDLTGYMTTQWRGPMTALYSAGLRAIKVGEDGNLQMTGFFGVDKSQNTSCVPLISAEFFHSS